MTNDLDQKNIFKSLQEASHCLKIGALKEAEKLCYLVLKFKPDQPDALHLLAVNHAKSGQFKVARDFFAKAIAAAPSRADFHANYGNALWEQGHFDEAENLCLKAISLNQHSADAHNILGNVYLSQHCVEKAFENFQKALKFRPDFPCALNNAGIVLQRFGKTEEAIKYYQKAIELQENYPEAFNNLGLSFKYLGKIQEAERCFRKAHELRPHYEKAVLNLAEVDSAWLEPLEGQRLLLRRFQEEDTTFLHKCYQNDEFLNLYNQYIPRDLLYKKILEKVRSGCALHPCQTKSVDWIILKKNSYQPIGIANLAEVQFLHRRAEFLVGLLSHSDRTSGYGVEATLLVFDYAFNRIGLNKLTSIVYGYNAIAQKNTLAIGFKQEGYLRQQVLRQNSFGFLDVYCNGILKDDFLHNKRLIKLSKRLLGRDITRSN